MIFLIEFCLAIAAVALCITAPGVGSRGFEACERAFAKLAQRRRLCVVVVGLAALAARAALWPIIPVPRPGVQDEFGYLLLADTFAHGRLTNPTHPMWLHFETFYTIWHPTYTAMFYPAQGLVMALGQVLTGNPFWGVWLSVGLMCGAICWMLQAWLPAEWALLGGFLAVIRLGTFNYWANSYFGGAVAAIGGSLVLGALPRIKRSQRVRDALLMGLGFALIANSRPYEGLFFGLPVAASLLVWMGGKNRPPLREMAKRVAAPILLLVVLTACGMGYYFWRTTGTPWDSPYLVYLRTYHQGGAAWGGRAYPWQRLGPAPVYHHAVLQEAYETSRQYYEKRRSLTASIGGFLSVWVKLWDFYLGPALTLPFLVAVASLPFGFSWRDISSDTRFLMLVCGVVIAGSMLPNVFLPHCIAPITGAILALVLQAMRHLRSRTGRGLAVGRFISRAVPLICMIMLVLRAGARPLHLPEPRRWLIDGPPIWCAPTPSNEDRAKTLADLQQRPGLQLVIVRYGPHHENAYHEWVYNGADMAGAKVIWARDMGATQNRELVDYFHDRHVWLVEADNNPPSVLPYAASP